VGYVEEMWTLVGPCPLLLAGVGVVLLDGAGRIVLQRRADDGAWDVLGGFLEPGESYEQAARREAREELGRDLDGLQLLGVYAGPDFFHRYPNGDAVHVAGAAFLARLAPAAGRPADGEVREVGAFELDAPPTGLRDSARRLLDTWGGPIRAAACAGTGRRR
jgi:ADP-ribose pyrophosphatase YjhB (NUDIX family)